MKKTVIENLLASFAKKTLANHRPQIVGVTGSVGKSSAKEAIGAVLGTRFQVRTSPKNFNTEIGLPLTVLDLPTGGKSAVRWLGILWKGWMTSMTKDKTYPAMLVLEYGMQNRGDIAKLCDIAPPDIAVVTTVGESHMEFMGSVEAIEKEKRVLVERLSKAGIAVLNRDDERVWAMRAKTHAEVVSYGYHEEADVRALADSLAYVCSPDRECGMRVKISTGAGTDAGATVPVFIPNVLGRHAVYAALAAAAVGLHKGMNLVEISDALSLYVAPAGRMRYVPGIKHTVIIDDTYNAAPKSVLAALETLRNLPVGEGGKRIAVLGDMLELGTATEDGHGAVGRKAAECADVIVFVGERMTFAEQAAHEAGADESRVFHFAVAAEAGRFIQERMKTGDVVLVKGSQGMRMERVVREIMAEPLDAEKLLVRQDAKWVEMP
jgi:UDP-N-acetylmuramoyl-tripeptide--D-alanyl-D-alanine ligase